MEKYIEEYFKELTVKLEKIQKMGWIKSMSNGSGSVGITLEILIGKELDSFEIPDYNGIELKAKCNKSVSQISLFNATPDSYLFEIKRIQKLYGYPDKELPQFNVFNISIYSNKKTYIGRNLNATIKVDYEEEKIVMNVTNKNGSLVDSLTSWSFDLIKEKVQRKLKYLMLVKADKSILNEEVFYKYTDFHAYKLKDWSYFFKAIENGNIRITFKVGIRRNGNNIGKICDHGTSFDIAEKDLLKIYSPFLYEK